MRLIHAVLATTFALSAGVPVQLLPAGEFAARDGRPGPGKTWKLSDERGRALAFEVSAIAALNNVPIDYDHQTLHVTQNGQKAPAAGWIKNATWRDGEGLFGEVTWTPAATKHITDGEYRYISPVIAYDEDTGEISAVLMAALVNFPGLVGMEPVVAQLASQFSSAGGHTGSLTPTESLMNPILAALLTALGLSQTATQEQALAALAAARAPTVPAALATELALQGNVDVPAAVAAVAALKAKTVASSDTATIAALQATVLQLQTQLNANQVDAIVTEALAAKKLLPAMKDWATKLGKTNLTELQAFIAAAPAVSLEGQTGGSEGGRDGQGAAALSATEQMLAKQMGLDTTKYAEQLKQDRVAA